MTERPSPPHVFSPAFSDAVALIQGVGIEADPARGAQLLAASCVAGDTDACAYAWLENTGLVCAIPREALRVAIDARKSQIRGCYENSEDLRAGKSGKLAITFLLDDESRIFFVSADRDSGFSDAFVECMNRVIFSLRVPKPACSGHGIILVHYPFVFTAQ